jgi:hypothetical protein
MALPRPHTDPVYIEIVMNPWFMNAPLPFDPFAPTPEYREVVEQADLLAAVVVGDIIARFLAQAEISSLKVFYASVNYALMFYDLGPAELAISDYLGEDEESYFATNNPLRAAVAAFVHYDMFARFVARRKDGHPFSSNSNDLPPR